MSRFAFRMLALVALLLIPWLGIRVLLPALQNSTADPEFAACAFAVWLGSPFLGLMALELVSRRALGLGFTVVRRDESRGLYWFYIGIHATMAFVVMAAALVYTLKK
jgi:hypothetical protein